MDGELWVQSLQCGICSIVRKKLEKRQTSVDICDNRVHRLGSFSTILQSLSRASARNRRSLLFNGSLVVRSNCQLEGKPHIFFFHGRLNYPYINRLMFHESIPCHKMNRLELSKSKYRVQHLIYFTLWYSQAAGEISRKSHPVSHSRTYRQRRVIKSSGEIFAHSSPSNASKYTPLQYMSPDKSCWRLSWCYN